MNEQQPLTASSIVANFEVQGSPVGGLWVLEDFNGRAIAESAFTSSSGGWYSFQVNKWVVPGKRYLLRLINSGDENNFYNWNWEPNPFAHAGESSIGLFWVDGDGDHAFRTYTIAGLAEVASITPQAQEFEHTEVAGFVEIQSNAGWNLERSDEWFTVYPNFGVGPGILELNLEENLEHFDRSGSLSESFAGLLEIIQTVDPFMAHRQFVKNWEHLLYFGENHKLMAFGRNNCGELGHIDFRTNSILNPILLGMMQLQSQLGKK